MYSAHIDTFARDRLPPPEAWPHFNRAAPDFAFPERLNAAEVLLDGAIGRGFAARPALRGTAVTWTYAELLERANRVAHVLVENFGVVPGNRVLIRSANNPMTVACWMGVAKAGGINVATMPLLRAGELAAIVDRTEAKLALTDRRLAEEMARCRELAPGLERIAEFDGTGAANGELERLMAAKPIDFSNVPTAAEDIALIAFTSGTTGAPKGAMHSHRDVIAITRTFPRAVLKPVPDDVFIGTPSLAFTFGFGTLAIFPLCFGASTVLLETLSPEVLLNAIQDYEATLCFTVPTGYRAMLRAMAGQGGGAERLGSLRLCASAGEALPVATFEAWRRATGHSIVDGIGTTEMLNHFISAPLEAVRPGATGKPLPGYEARIVDEELRPLPPGETGLLAVRGPTGCRYLDDPRQSSYVRDGWNLTGDSFTCDEDGYFWYAARNDDMIVSSGYNIAGPEVEDALLSHPAVAECAVVAAPDADRGSVPKAYVVPADSHPVSEGLVRELQDFVKQRIAPYKYPRRIGFLAELPRTETGKVQRYKLRERAAVEAE
ncbi:MAG: AMP-binding protein [Alphaproteobacteria bacterium]|nr:AMP-binding protein [Alphaproteobacteria bacterium]